MKTCPICGARAFDDAAVCYGCLYRFTEGEQQGDGLRSASVPPAFLIRLRAVQAPSGEYCWTCEVKPESPTAAAAA